VACRGRLRPRPGCCRSNSKPCSTRRTNSIVDGTAALT
jgi:hypothetical protein